MKKVVIVLLTSILMFIGMQKVSAGRGCCSHHGGQAYCSNGRWVCNDGTYSPTCTCSGGSSSGNRSYNTTTRRTTTIKQVYGCMDKSAINYNYSANVSDGSCQYEKIETSKENIYYSTETKGSLTSGEKEIVREGKNGEKEVIIKKIVNENGVEVSSEKVNETVIVEPVNEIVEYHARTTRAETSAKTEEKESNTPLVVTIILLIVNIYYGYKNKDANLLINKIKLINSGTKYILYFLYFIFIIPVFIDIVLVIIDFFKKNKQS